MKETQEQQTNQPKTTQERYGHAANLFASVVSSVVAKKHCHRSFLLLSWPNNRPAHLQANACRAGNRPRVDLLTYAKSS